ncbi:MAG TPA: orotidine-5'-phosphate decarboxylase [candidate division Zixibacteria bacterium]|nr:orotidine-5'-phosphate decarboxylase [candidate division Zixibacteria bacterium]
MNSFFRKIVDNFEKKGTCLCVGLDPEPSKIPHRYAGSETPYFDFLADVVEATHEFVCAYKPNIAFFESAGPNGLDQLIRLIRHIHDIDEDIPVILDAKRGDIGNTAKHYAKAVFDIYSADGATVSPYMGGDTLTAFIEREDAGIFVLCLTSNPGYADFENLAVDGEPLFVRVARKMAEIDRHGNIGLVVGATHPSEAEKVRETAPELPFLMPGIGAQGGDPSAIMKIGMTSKGIPPIVNSSRGILYPEQSTIEAVRESAIRTRDMLRRYT